MRNNLLLLLLLILAAAAISSQPESARAASASPSYPISMGFSPSALSTTGQGVPVYTGGDQVWLMSESNLQLTATVLSPDGATVASATLMPTDPVFIHSFSSSDPAGSWSLRVSDSSSPPLGTEVIPFLLTQPDLVPSDLTSYALSGSGQLRMNLTQPATTQYEIRACAVGRAPPETASFQIPASVGSGQLLLGKNGSQLEISTQGRVSSPFDFWVELHQNYSYSLVGSSAVVSRDVRVAATTAISLSPGETSANATLEDYVQTRDGRFTVRAFFDTSAGISVAQTSVLIPDGDTWISLPGCSASADVGSKTFSLTASLGAASSRWPASVYTMYTSDGVEMVSETALDLMPAVLTVVASPWETTLTDSSLTFIPGPGVDESASANGTLYLIAARYPVQIGVSVPGDPVQSVAIGHPFSTTQTQVNSSKLSVITYLNGNIAPGVSIDIVGGGAAIAHAVSGGSFSLFYLPQGNYTIDAVLGNTTNISSVLLQTGRTSVLRIDFTTQPDQEYVYLLLAAATIGATTSALVWLKVYRDRR